MESERYPDEMELQFDETSCPLCGCDELFEAYDGTLWCPQCSYHRGISVKEFCCPACGGSETVFENGLLRCPACGCSVLPDCDNVEALSEGSGQYRITGLKAVEVLPGITALNAGFQEFTALERVILPEEIVRISHDAFSGCSSLREIRIPESVRELLSNVFCGCAFREITLPEGLTQIDDFTFCDCSKLEHITLPEGIRRIGTAAFQYCTAL